MVARLIFFNRMRDLPNILHEPLYLVIIISNKGGKHHIIFNQIEGRALPLIHSVAVSLAILLYFAGFQGVCDSVTCRVAGIGM